jgi:hypothetical protein
VDLLNAALRAELYRTPNAHEWDRPRTGDLAEIKRDHCQSESGLLVQVMGEPHLMVARCHKCGQKTEEWMVEIHAQHGPWMKTPGPWFHPVRWLKRIDPTDPVEYARVRSYEPNAAQKWTA